jgi:hypothetical protein
MLTPLKPPLALAKNKNVNWTDDDYAIEKVARFVSLIPYQDDSKLFKGLPDMTCTA